MNEFKGINVQKVLMTPTMAIQLLEGADVNRNIREHQVTMLEQIIRRGEWKVTHQGIAIGSNGKLWDGQHRLWAIVRSGISVPIFVTTGLDRGSREAIDKGSVRRLGDELQMFRGEKSANNLAAYLGVCANLLVSSPDGAGHGSAFKVRIPTLGMFDEWMGLFEPGVRWALSVFLPTTSLLRAAPVGGALAFAHKTNPAVIERFGAKIASGAGLDQGEPAWLLRRFLLETEQEKRRLGSSGSTPLVRSRKVLRAALAEITGQRMTKLEDTSAGIKHFRLAYDGRKAKELCKPWRVERGNGLDHSAAAVAAH